MQSVARWIVVLILIASPLVFAGSKDKDHELATEIQQRLSGIAPNTVIVVVDEATKTAFLTGHAATQAELDLIARTVRDIDGVRVIGSTMVVSGSEPEVALTTTPQTTIRTTTVETERVAEIDQETTDIDVDRTYIDTEDASLRAAVEDALSEEGITGRSKIRVEAENGVVTLTGAALSESHADRIVTLAMSVPGVRDVNPNLTIRDQDNRRYTPKPSDDRDKDGFEVDQPESRVDDDDDDR